MGRPRREDGRKAHTVATNKYAAENYDRLSINIKKGEREKVKAYAEQRGETVGGLVNRLLAAEITDFTPITNK